MKKGFVYLLVSNFVFIAAGYATNILLARKLGPEVYGTYGLVIGILSTVNLFQTAGLPQSTSKFVSENNKNKEKIFGSSLVIQSLATVVISLIYFFSAVPIAKLLNDNSLIPYLRFSSLVLPFYGIYSLYSGYYNGLHMFKKQSIINIVYSIAKLFTVIGFTLVFHLYGTIAGFILSPLIALILIRPLTLLKSVRIFNYYPYKKLIYYSIPLIGFAFFSTLLQSIDLYFIKASLVSDKEVGFYAANQNISRIPYFALSAFALVLFPGIARSVSIKDTKGTKRLIETSMRYILIVLVPATLLLSATSRQIIQILFSQSYLDGASSLTILVLGLGFLTVFNCLGNILNGGGYAKLTVYISVVGIITTAILCYILIPAYGLAGAALSTTFGGFATAVISLYFIQKYFGASINITSLIKILFSSGIIYFAAKYITLPLIILPFYYLILTGIYVFLLLVLKEIKNEDLKLAKKFSPKFIKLQLFNE